MPPNPTPPELSVVVPQAQADPRAEPGFLKSWTRQRGVDPSRYEVIVACNSRGPVTVDRFRSFLRPRDRVVAEDCSDEFLFYEHGIRAARGRLILLTEDHCAARPDLVYEVLRFFDETQASAAFLNSDSMSGNLFAQIEGEEYQQLIEEMLAQTRQSGRVTLRGFVVDKSILAAAGGIPWQYSLYCGNLLGVRLERMGVEIAFIRNAKVVHRNVDSPAHLRHEVRAYVRGLCMYLEDPDAWLPDEEKRLGLPSIWRRRYAWHDGASGDICAALAGSVFRPSPGRNGVPRLSRVRLLRELLRWMPHALAGVSAVRWRRRIGTMLAALSFHGQKRFPGRRITAFREFWRSVTEEEHAVYCASSPPEHSVGNWQPFRRFAERHTSELIGFYQLEEYEGREFRWSEPVCALKTRLKAGRYTFTVDTGGIRDTSRNFQMEVFFGGIRVCPSTVEGSPGLIRFPVEVPAEAGGRRQLLVLVVNPWDLPRRLHGETRRLGLPVFEIDMQPAGTMPTSVAAHRETAAA